MDSRCRADAEQEWAEHWRREHMASDGDQPGELEAPEPWRRRVDFNLAVTWPEPYDCRKAPVSQARVGAAEAEWLESVFGKTKA